MTYLLVTYLLLPSGAALFIPYTWRTCPIALLKYSFFIVPLEIIAKVVAIIFNPVVMAYSVVFELQNLPKYLKWFQVHDDTLDGGQHQLGWVAATGFKLWLQRTKFHYRNLAYGFSYFLGVKVFTNPEDRQDNLYVGINYGTWDSGHSNKNLRIEKLPNGKFAFGLRGQFYFYKNWYVRYWLGYKLQGSIALGKVISVQHISIRRFK